MEMSLDLLIDVINGYAEQARCLGAAAEDERIERDYLQMAAALEAIVIRPPETLREAAQLTWLYTMISGTVNYGRMDVYLGAFYAADVDGGRLSEPEALRLIQSLWQLIADRRTIFNGRVFIGGRGRPDEVSADRFALLAMEATRTVIADRTSINPALLSWDESGPDDQKRSTCWGKAAPSRCFSTMMSTSRLFSMLSGFRSNTPNNTCLTAAASTASTISALALRIAASTCSKPWKASFITEWML